MQHAFSTHIREVLTHYETADHGLALRRLLDCAIETRDPVVFAETLAFCDWNDTLGMDEGAFRLDKVRPLLEQIERVGIKDPYQGPKEVLAVENVAKKYAKSGFQISNLNFSLELSKISGLVGENGNGKTTLLRLLASELKPDSGKISYFFPEGMQDAYSLKTKLIYIEQRIPRWYGSLMDNLQFTVSHYHDKPEENRLWTEIMIARLGLRPYRHLTWGRLSSGYRTRFELAKTLLRRPKILLLDEPLANLDIVAQQTILQDLKFMANSVSAPFAMILSSQHIYEVEKVSDSIIFIRDGVARYDAKSGNADQAESESQLILELEVNASREALKAALDPLGLSRIQYNGGVYLLHFSAATSSSEVLGTLAKNEVETLYFRNISQSSRRFFHQ